MVLLADSSGIGWDYSGVCCLGLICFLVGFVQATLRWPEVEQLASHFPCLLSYSNKGAICSFWWQGAGRAQSSTQKVSLGMVHKGLYLICCILLTKVSHKSPIQWLNWVWEELQSSHCQGNEYAQRWKIEKVFAINFHSRYFGMLEFSPCTVSASLNFISLKFRKVWKRFSPSHKKSCPF